MRTTNKHRGLIVVVLIVGGLSASLSCSSANDAVAASPSADSGRLDVEQSPDAMLADESAALDAASCSSDFVVDATCQQPAPAASCTDGFCTIPAGCFVMGSPSCEPGRGAYSEDEVQVTLTRDFLLEQFETSQAEWTAAGFSNPSRVDRDGNDCLEPDCPVGHINWFEAAAFANRKSDLAGLGRCYVLDQCTGAPGTGMTCDAISLNAPSLYECEGYRLPSEAEWEYAARAGTRTAFYSGPVHSSALALEKCPFEMSLESIAWYCHNSGTHTHPRGQLSPNAWGLYDMLGNQAEWVHDRFNGLGYGTGPLVDPHGQLEVDGTQYTRVTRGGVYVDTPTILRAADRFDELPSFSAWGLRLARSIAK